MQPAERDAWRQADRILDEILDLPSEQRPAKLAALAPDPELHQRVQRLLAAHAEDGGLLERPIAVALLPEAQSALTGRRLGRWRLLEEIGRGGMAVVYRAIADEGDAAGQLAALKVLSIGTLASDGRERFVHEQQALLRLRHPYLAQLYDTGVADDGTPWLAMALVEGERIDDWCMQRDLDLAARVRLLLQVCDALSYSHRNLVIHRDIKPSNVLVDDDGHVRVLDFGIARLADGAADERTATALRALTPEYAAPEQFEGAPPSTGMDVYGLGALAYRLLTEQPPRWRSTGAGPPTAPPSRAVRQADRLDEAERRLRARLLRGDLDTVLMKALAERAEQRYASVEALAEDLRRWLDRRPVLAHAPSWRYRAGKFVARNRLGVSAAALLLLALGAGLAGTLWQARLAQQEAARARTAAEQSQAQLAYLDSVLEVLAPTTAEARERDRGELLAEIGARARRELATRPRLLATVELSLGGVAERIGDYTQAAALYESAMSRRRAQFGAGSAEVAEAQLHWGAMLDLRGPADPIAAEAQLRAAVATLRGKSPNSELLVEALVLWANKLGDRDHYPQARAALAEADAICRRDDFAEQAPGCEQVWLTQGMLASRAARAGDAIAPLQRLVALRELRYGMAHAQTLFARGELGKAHARNGQSERGLALLEQVHAQQQRIYPKPTRETLRTLQDLAEILGDLGHYPRARLLRQRHLQQARELHGEQHADVAVSYANLGNLLFADGRYREAADAYERGRAIYAALYGEQHAGAMISLGNYADALRELGRAAEALPLQRRVLVAMEQVFGADSPRYASRLGNLARTLVAHGQVAPALPMYARSHTIYRASETGDDYRAAVIAAYRSQALALLGRNEEALRESRAALAEVASKAGREHRFYWEALAIHLQAACAVGNSGCAALRAQATRSLDGDAVPGGARLKLQAVLAATAANH